MNTCKVLIIHFSRWRARANSLIEKQNKNSPEDFKRLTIEKENLTKQLATATEELKVLKLEKSKLEEQLNNVSYKVNSSLLRYEYQTSYYLYCYSGNNCFEMVGHKYCNNYL